MDITIRSRLSDIIEVSQKEHLREYGQEYIQQLETELTDEERVIIFFFFRDALWLLRCEMFDIANLLMIITVEDCFRKKILPNWDKSSEEDDKTEDKSLEPLWNEFKKRYPAAGEKIKSDVEYLKKIRGSYVHTNMKNAVNTILLKDSNLLMDENTKIQFASSVGTVRGHEMARISLKRLHTHSTKLLRNCIRIVKLIYPDEILGIAKHFDETLEQSKNGWNYILK